MWLIRILFCFFWIGILWQSWSNMTCDSNCEFCRMDTYSYWKSASQIYCCKMKSRFFLKQPFSCNMKYWIQNNVCFFLFFWYLAHLNRRFKSAFLITHCPSSVCLSVNFSNCCSLKTLGRIKQNVVQSIHIEKGNSNCLKKELNTFQKGDNCQIVSIRYLSLKLFLSRTTASEMSIITIRFIVKC